MSPEDKIVYPGPQRETEGDKISPETQVVLLSTLFFYAKYLRRNRLHDPVLPEPPAEDDAHENLRWLITTARSLDKDVDGDIEGFVSGFLDAHPRRAEFFSDFTVEDMRAICEGLNQFFEEDEWCAFSEASSLYDNTTPCDFAIDNTARYLEILCGNWRTTGMKQLDRIRATWTIENRGEIVTMTLAKFTHAHPENPLALPQDLLQLPPAVN